MLNNLNQNLSGYSFTNFDTNEPLDQSERPTLENFYKYDDCLENATESSIKNDKDERSSSASSTDKYQIIQTKIFKNVYCPKCATVCKVLILETGYLSMECKCSKIINISANEFINDYLHSDNYKKDTIESNCSIKQLSDLGCCSNHSQKFLFYCKDCFTDVCEKCLEEKVSFPKSKTYNICENHLQISLDPKDNINIFDDINNFIEKIERDIQFSEEDGKTLEHLFLIIKCFIENYNQYPCYNSLKSIQKFKEFLEIIILNSENSFYRLKSREGFIIHLIKINSQKELNSKIHSFRNLYSIDIRKTGKNIDLSILKNHVFPYLRKLMLRENQIKDISFLLDSEFPNLEKIDIEKNKLDDKVIEVLARAKLPKLRYLNLFANEIKSLKIFDVLKNFEELRKFYIGDNKFDVKELECDKSNFILPNDLEEFGLTGIFRGNIDFVTRLPIDNLKILYISRNELTSLKGLKNIEFKRLDEFWATNNNITDIKEIINIQGKKNVWKINLKENKISNFHELFYVIKDFKNLKKLILTGNNIGKKDAEDMEKRIKAEHKIELEIIV